MASANEDLGRISRNESEEIRVSLQEVGKHTFRGQAEVVGSGPRPKEGKYRHNLRWLSLNDQAKAALSKLTGTPR